MVRKAGNNGFEAYRQLCLMYGTSDQEGSTGLFVQIMTYKFGSKIQDVEDRLNEFLEMVRRYEEANGTDPVPDQAQKACIISNMPEPLKTHLQLNDPVLRMDGIPALDLWDVVIEVLRVAWCIFGRSEVCW